MEDILRGLIVCLLILLSMMWFGIGLVAPLTPSSGLPSVGELIVFAGFPLGLLAAGFTVSNHIVAKVTLTILSLFVIAVTGSLMWTMTH